MHVFFTLHAKRLRNQEGSSNGTKSEQSMCYQTGQVYSLLTEGDRKNVSKCC